MVPESPAGAVEGRDSGSSAAPALNGSGDLSADEFVERNAALGDLKIRKPEISVSADYEGDFVFDQHLPLECGRVLNKPTLRYAVYGRLNDARDNVVLVGHALSGSALVGEWWPGLFYSAVRTAGDKPRSDRAANHQGAAGKVAGSQSLDSSKSGIVDLDKDCVICINLLGSCYGSTGPGSTDPETGQAYGPEFPVISIRDNVRAQARLLHWLGVNRIRLAIGGSIGGMQALEWSILYPELVIKAVIIAVAPLGAMGLALNHLQRQAIIQDPDWKDGRYAPEMQPRRGLGLARGIAMLSYKSGPLFDERFGRKPNRSGEDPWSASDPESGLAGGRFDVAGFLDYQGERFLERFDANSYLAILRTMDLWDPGKEYANTAEALGRIQAEVVFVGISSDWLFPAEDVRRLAQDARSAGVRSEYREMRTDHGHDAFLAEQEKLVALLKPPLDAVK